jgi:hypothetical protein
VKGFVPDTMPRLSRRSKVASRVEGALSKDAAMNDHESAPPDAITPRSP